MSDSFDVDVTLPDAAVRGMARELCPTWTVSGIDRQSHGTDFVAIVEAETAAGPDSAVLKATTAGLVGGLARAEPRLLQLVAQRTTVPVPTVFGYADSHDEYPAPFYLMWKLRLYLV